MFVDMVVVLEEVAAGFELVPLLVQVVVMEVELMKIHRSNKNLHLDLQSKRHITGNAFLGMVDVLGVLVVGGVDMGVLQAVHKKAILVLAVLLGMVFPVPVIGSPARNA